ncbi:MAG: NAD-dependent epimerase/dehydratase family protein [Trueperaceae bacterium]
MNILFIGGSRFVGKHAVLEAVKRGHSVTLFNRGTQPLPTPEVRHIQGDRNEDLGRLAGERFDAVIDTSGYLPHQVKTAAQALAERATTYLFISTISVYADQTRAFQDENAALIELSDPTVEEVTGETYGGLKVLCERALDSFFPGRRLNIRPGVVVGPSDTTDRFTYWPVRLSRGGEVLAPGKRNDPVQWIDARDLATWVIEMLEGDAQGTYNAVSQADRFTVGGLLDASQRASGSQAQVTWVAEEFLLERGVKAFVDLPMWLAGEQANFLRIDGTKAHDAGLMVRPIEESVDDTLEWFRAERQGDLKTGLGEERERELLAEWRDRSD